jgi:GntR family transcriptional repressor for pyruvate dehydrogenase complex
MNELKTDKQTLSEIDFEKQSTSERLADVFLKKIQNGELENGYRLPPQRELAQLFGVGMSSVREAINTLNVMGYVDVQHGRGTFVVFPPEDKNGGMDVEQALKLNSLSDVMTGRLVIECASVELAAELAKKEDLEEIKRCIEAMEASIGDMEAWYDADLLGFHVSLAKASHNLTLVEVVKTLCRRVRDEHVTLMTQALDHYTVENCRRAVQSAKVVYSRVKAGDSKGASFALRQHLSIVLDHEHVQKSDAFIINEER